MSNYTLANNKVDFNLFSRSFNSTFVEHPGAQFTFEFERQLIRQLPQWDNFIKHYTIVPWMAAVLYCLMVWLLKNFMHSRDALQLRWSLFVWNTALALFSIIGSVRSLPEFMDSLTNYGFNGAICQAPLSKDPRYYVWIYLFVFSKIWEFGDTIFVLLRKQRLITLHWTHHALTQLFSWYTLVDIPMGVRWPFAMNFTVHSLMYSYYALMAIGIRVPSTIASKITALQIAQMLLGFYTFTVMFINGKQVCGSSDNVLLSGVLLYAFFLSMFVKFFIDRFLYKRNREQKIKIN